MSCAENEEFLDLRACKSKKQITQPTGHSGVAYINEYILI